MRSQPLEPEVGVVREERRVGRQHYRLVTRLAQLLADCGVDIAVVRDRVRWTHVSAHPITVGVRVGDRDLGLQYLRNVLGKRHRADRGHHDRRDLEPRWLVDRLVDGLGSFEESEYACCAEQHYQHRFEPEREQRRTGHRGSHRHQRPQVHRHNTDAQGLRASRRRCAHCEPQHPDHAQRTQQ